DVEDRRQDRQCPLRLPGLFGREGLGDQQEVEALPFRPGLRGVYRGRVQVVGGPPAVVPVSGDQRGHPVQQQRRRTGLAQPVERDLRAVLDDRLQLGHRLVPTALPVVVHGGRHLQSAGQR